MLASRDKHHSAGTGRSHSGGAGRSAGGPTGSGRPPTDRGHRRPLLLLLPGPPPPPSRPWAQVEVLTDAPVGALLRGGRRDPRRRDKGRQMSASSPVARASMTVTNSPSGGMWPIAGHCAQRHPGRRPQDDLLPAPEGSRPSVGDYAGHRASSIRAMGRPGRWRDDDGGGLAADQRWGGGVVEGGLPKSTRAVRQGRLPGGRRGWVGQREPHRPLPGGAGQ